MFVNIFKNSKAANCGVKSKNFHVHSVKLNFMTHTGSMLFKHIIFGMSGFGPRGIIANKRIFNECFGKRFIKSFDIFFLHDLTKLVL